jgi:hypothetical protein
MKLEELDATNKVSTNPAGKRLKYVEKAVRSDITFRINKRFISGRFNSGKSRGGGSQIIR